MTLPLQGSGIISIKPSSGSLPSDQLGIKGLNFIQDHLTTFKSDKSWLKPLEKQADVYVVVGPPNCGKSTFIGYLVNQLASKMPILYLEADCGQPNYSIPGSLQLMELDCTESI